MKITKKFVSETSHIVRKATSLRCLENIHGHSYKWFVTVKGDLNEAGMVLDFKDLSPVKQFIDLFDHCTVFWGEEKDEIIQFFKNNFKRILVMRRNPTAENMARLVFKFTQDWLSLLNLRIQVNKVEVWETATGCGIAEECDENDVLDYTHNNKD